jgi:hypothetical protein
MIKEKDLKKEIAQEKINFQKLKCEIFGKIRKVNIDDFDAYLDIESALLNMKNSINYYYGLKFASHDLGEQK